MAPQKKPKAGAKPKAEAKPKSKAVAKPRPKAVPGPKPKSESRGRGRAAVGAVKAAVAKTGGSPRGAKVQAKPRKQTKQTPEAPPPKRQQKPVARRKIRRRIVRRPPALLATVSVGDAVRIPVESGGAPTRSAASAAQPDRGGEALEGIVSSIREIATGRLVPKTTGDLSQYVLEVVHSQTFQLHYASDRNTGGPRGAEDIRQNPIWRKLRSVLREMAAKKRMVSVSQGGATEEPLRSLLDGWRVVRVKARQVEAVT